MPFSIRPFRGFPVPFLKLPQACFSDFWVFIVLLVLSSGPAYAEWVSLDANNQGGRTV
jgi:hypothetical protein